MIGIDSNVLVRYITQDEPAQARIATEFLEKRLSAGDPGFIPSVVLAELVWVLEDLYSVKKAELLDIVEKLSGARQLMFEHADAVPRALRSYRSAKCGLVDCLIAEIASSEGCEHVVTFDRKAARSAGFRILTRP